MNFYEQSVLNILKGIMSSSECISKFINSKNNYILNILKIQ